MTQPAIVGKTIKQRLEDVKTELEDILRLVTNEVEGFEPGEDEDEESPWEDCHGQLNEAHDNLEEALNSAPDE